MQEKQKRTRKCYSILLFTVFIFCCNTMFAQQKTITGTVTETNGEPIIGASVRVDGGSAGTVTDLDGKYSISVSEKSKKLVISYLGFNTKEIPIKGTTVNVQLEESTTALDELVVIGYGAIPKKDLTGSVASISSKQLEAIPVTNVSEAMTGKLPGVNITSTEGSPDADIKIRVRGGGSLSQDNSPLYIVDGFEARSISDISPSEIQSIDVLKDASSTAIYGAKGANGVIIVTTKSGSEGKVQVSLGASFGLKKATKLVKTLSPYDYAMYQYEIGSTDYGNFNDLEIWKSVKGYDYQDEIFGRTGNQSQYNVNVSGGTKETKFSITYAHSDEKSIMLGSGFNKDNINAKINTNLTKNLKLDFNARFNYTTLKGLSGGADTNESNAANSLVANSVRFRPIDTLVSSDDDDEENSTSRQYNPLERMLATYKRQRSFNQTYNAGLSWSITKNLTARSEFGYSWRFDNADQVWETPATSNSSLGYSGLPQAIKAREDRTNWRNANTLTYDNKKMFGGRDHLNVLIGHEVSSNQAKRTENTSVNFPNSLSVSDILANMGHGLALANYSYIGAKENMLSFFGRVNYTYNEKYLFTATMRADGSSKFAEGNQWGVFPSAAIAWRMNDEEFMAASKSWLSNLKFRLSFGTAGNNRIKSGLISRTFTLSKNNARGPFFGGDATSMMEVGNILPNPNLKWETTITRNLGFDYGLWNNRLAGTLDLYWNTTKDLLMQSEIPPQSGYLYQFRNFGQTSNKGIEFSLTAVAIDTKDFGLNFNMNISYNQSRIDKLATDNPWQSSNWSGSTIAKYEDFQVKEGGRLGEVWGYKTNGFYTVYDETTNPNGDLVWNNGAWALREGADNSYTITGGSYYPGGLKLKCDKDGNPIKEKLGNTIAPVYGGFGFDGRYKNFDFNAFFNYSVGNVIVNGTKLATSFYVGSAKGYNLNDDFTVGDRYTWIDPETGLNLGRGLSNSTITKYDGIQNVINRLNEINANAIIYNPAAVSTMQLTDYAVEKASFLRVNNISIGYTLPRTITRKLSLSTVRFYVTGYNLYCFTNYSGADPEVDVSSKKNAMTPGIDYASYPKSRSFVVGANISF